MRLHIFSDLHMDSRGWQPPDHAADVYVVAGDLYDDGRHSARWCAELAQSRGKPVLFTPGNHEFYGARVGKRLKEMADICKKGDVTLLQNRSVVLGCVRFAGTTTWTDFLLDGVGYQVLARNAARQMVHDFTGIFVGDGKGQGKMLTPEYTERMHQRARRFLGRALVDAYEEPVVVVTHHAPSRSSISAQFERSALNPAFASDMDNFVGYSNARLLVHGHVHHSLDYLLGATRVVCNPRGHPKGLNPTFQEGLIVETNDFAPVF
jgi:3',5'-cyclic AMP phosphodiesterase CpdA